MNVSVQTLPKNTYTLTITISVEEVKKSEEKLWEDIIKNAEVDGFRKGNAPAELVRQKINPKKVESELVSDLIKTYYPQAVEQQKLNPVIAPKVQFENFDAQKDFTFSATFATRPTLIIGDYKKALKEKFDKKNTLPSVTPPTAGQSANTSNDKPTSEPAKEPTHLSPNEIIDAIISVTTGEVSDLLIEEEVNKMLSRLVNQIQAIKLDMETYLKSQNKTGDSLRTEYTQIAQRSIIGELALIEVVRREGIETTDTEVEETLNAMGDPKLKEQYSKDDYRKAYIKAIIAKNKLIWKLSLPAVVGSPEKEENNANKDVK